MHFHECKITKTRRTVQSVNNVKTKTYPCLKMLALSEKTSTLLSFGVQWLTGRWMSRWIEGQFFGFVGILNDQFLFPSLTLNLCKLITEILP